MNRLSVSDTEAFCRIKEACKSDPNIYHSMLLMTKYFLDAHNVSFFLGFGTLLGAVREKWFIKNDHDVDIMILEKDEDKLVKAIQSDEFKNSHLELIRVHYPFLISLGYVEQYLDIYVMRPVGDNYQCWVLNVEKWRLDQPDEINFIGNRFLIPKDPETYLERVYGDWRTPSNKHAES